MSMIIDRLAPACVALALMVGPATAQDSEIFIPKRDTGTEPVEEVRSANPLAQCLSTMDPDDCAAAALVEEGETFETALPDQRVVLETFTLNLGTGKVDSTPPDDYVAPKHDAPAHTKVSANALGITIEFEFGSSKIRASERDKLFALTAALSSPENAKESFVLLGHTDSVGSIAANCRLSFARAASVGQALRDYGAPNNFVEYGAGEFLLKNKAYPEAAENRRVSILKLEGYQGSPLFEEIALLCAPH